MPPFFSSLVAFVLLLAPFVALAGVPSNPYDYPVRGAYLVVFFAAVIVITLELFRLVASTAAVKRWFRLAAFGFGLVLIVAVIFGAILHSLEMSWQKSLSLDLVAASGPRWLSPDSALIGFVVLACLLTLSAFVSLYLWNRQVDFWWRVKAVLLSLLLSGTVAIPFLYYLATCTGYCGL
jgi:hypothetical protein